MVIAKTDGMDLMRDRGGVIRYSDVEIQFPYSVIRDEAVAKLVGFEVRAEPQPLTVDWLDSLHPDIEKISIFVVNRLLRAYRLLSGEHYVRPVTLSDVFYMQTGWLVPHLQNPFKTAVGAPHQAITLQAHPFSESFHEELARWVVRERDVPIWIELVHDARDYLEVGRFRHVVIDMRTALEVYIDQTLLACFKQRDLSPVVVATLLRLPKRIARSVVSAEDAIRWARINDKLKYGIKEALGIQLARRKVWNTWLAVKEMREGSVHYGEDVSEDEARTCLETIETLMNLIHEASSPVSAALTG
ncbi:MAG: hypothetical protein HYS09_05885 [Chloroflexi bacterium]|nr:hypothetical protein [Chloroflexota bacterium]